MALTGKQKRKLRGLGHHLAVVVQVGQHGLTDAVVMATDQALFDHELIKVQIAADRDVRKQLAEQLAEKTGSDVAQTLGRTVLLFKQRAEKSKISP